MERTMKPARSRARTLLPAAMPAMAGVGRGFAAAAAAVEEVGDGLLVWEVGGGGMRLAVAVRVMMVGGWDVRVRVEVMVVVASALRTLVGCVSVAVV